MPSIVEDALLVYTDGSLYPRGRRGGYGVVFIHIDAVGNETVVHEHAPPGARGVTNNRMELQACIDAVKIAPGIDCFHSIGRVVVRTDSLYVKDNYLNALGRWRMAGWRDGHDKPVANADLWKEFVRVHGKLRKRFQIQKVKAHGKGAAKDLNNYRADWLAKESATNPLAQSKFLSSVRRKFAPGKTEPGSVRLVGQLFIVYIIEVQRLRIHKTWRYRYQVLSPDSPDIHKIDWAYSEAAMRDGHCYEVQMNDDTRHPQVLAVHREVPRAEMLAPERNVGGENSEKN
jgi:ribonuclease HI